MTSNFRGILKIGSIQSSALKHFSLSSTFQKISRPQLSKQWVTWSPFMKVTSVVPSLLRLTRWFQVKINYQCNLGCWIMDNCLWMTIVDVFVKTWHPQIPCNLFFQVINTLRTKKGNFSSRIFCIFQHSSLTMYFGHWLKSRRNQCKDGSTKRWRSLRWSEICLLLTQKREQITRKRPRLDRLRDLIHLLHLSWSFLDHPWVLTQPLILSLQNLDHRRELILLWLSCLFHWLGINNFLFLRLLRLNH